MRNGINQKNKCLEVLKSAQQQHQGAANQPGQITVKHLLALSMCILSNQAPQQWPKPMFNSTSLNLALCRWSKRLTAAHLISIPSEEAVQCVSSLTFLLLCRGCQAGLRVPAAVVPVYPHSPVHQEQTGDQRVSIGFLNKYLQLRKVKQWQILRVFSVLQYLVG